MPKPSRAVRSRIGRALVALLTLTLGSTSLASCASGASNASGNLPVVLTTFTVLEDIAQNVAGEHLAVESITKVGAEIHGYEPTPGDLRRAQSAALILDNGLGLEAWFERFTQDLDVPHVVVSDGVRTIPIAEDAYEGRDNPHAWMSPLNAKVYVDNMVEAFSELDPEHADDFAANAADYKAELDLLQATLTNELATLDQDHRALVTCEGAFSYLARDAGMTEQYLWAVNAEQQATPRQIAETIAFVESRRVPAVFCESTVSDEPMQQVVDATAAVFGGTLYVDSLSGPDGPVPTYLDLVGHDIDVIVTALTGGSE